MNICLIQTCDPHRYLPLFDITSAASKRYSDLHRITYLPFIGIKRGYHPWHAAFNRIELLSDLLTQGFRGWVIYLDADAYPFDMRFDVRGYLRDNQRFGIIGASGGGEAWQPNSGIMLLNFHRPFVRDTIKSWQSVFWERWPDQRLVDTPEWPEQVDDDQALLHNVLRGDARHASRLKLERFDIMGCGYSQFLRQILRVNGTFIERCHQALDGVALALNTA